MRKRQGHFRYSDFVEDRPPTPSPLRPAPKNLSEVRVLLKSLADDLNWYAIWREKNPDAEYQPPHVRPQVVSLLAATPFEKIPYVRNWIERFCLGLVSVDESIGYLRVTMRLSDEQKQN